MPKIISEQTLDKYNESIRQKIADNVVKKRNGCWIWKRKKGYYGYGHTTYRSKSMSVHRVSWIVFKGEIPNGLCVCHKCDVPSCCNPEHLFLGTHKQNTRDMMQKKKVFDFVGEKNNQAILTNEIVLEMRKLKREGKRTIDIARQFNVKRATCSNAIHRVSWKHI